MTLIVSEGSPSSQEEDWLDVDSAVKAGAATGLPVMVDFGIVGGDRNLAKLLQEKLGPGDIYTHCYSGRRAELLPDGTLNPVMPAGRRRGVLFDVGHGGGSFYWFVAVPAFGSKFYPDTVSTDLHTGSMNAGMKDLTNVMSKMLNLGAPLADVIRMATLSAAQAIKRPQLGNLDIGAEADVTVLKVESGHFGFLDSAGAQNPGARRIMAEMTVRRGDIVWDLNGRAGGDWKTFPYREVLKLH